jgi:hypothetical protein
MKADWEIILAGAAGVVGFIEWAKGYFKMPGWTVRTLMPIVCLGVAMVQNGGWRQIAINGILMLAVCQIGYELIVQSVKNIISKVK